MITYPFCKINLGLRVTSQRCDGYHNIETIFYPVPITDALEVVEADRQEFFQTGLPIAGDQAGNLVVRAYEILKANYGLPPVKIHLHKQIPMGAGLGGGSADGAHMLMMLNKVFNLEIGREQLLEYALQLGSDCPFFIHGKPALATGRGEVIQDSKVSLEGLWLVLVKPPVHISTAEAYGNIQPHPSRLSLKRLIGFPVHRWKGNIMNQFEAYVFRQYPEVKQIKATLYEQRAIFALMSGTGSCVYGLFQSEKKGLEKYFPRDYQIFRQKL